MLRTFVFRPSLAVAATLALLTITELATAAPPLRKKAATPAQSGDLAALPAPGTTSAPAPATAPAPAPASASAPAPASASASASASAPAPASASVPAPNAASAPDAATVPEPALAPAPLVAPAARAAAVAPAFARSRASASSVRITVDSEAQSAGADVPPTSAPHTSLDDATVLHGIRFGYGYVLNYDKPVAALGGQSLKDKVGLRTPSHFLLGYEVVYRVVGHSWLNVILLGNAMLAGLEQSKVLPSANLLIGFEFKNSFQVGVGAHLEPLAGSEAHSIVAAGWTPRVGTIYMPVHFYFVPDVDGVHHLGMTTGVTF
jgi:hypothetical protein